MAIAVFMRRLFRNCDARRNRRIQQEISIGRGGLVDEDVFFDHEKQNSWNSAKPPRPRSDGPQSSLAVDRPLQERATHHRLNGARERVGVCPSPHIHERCAFLFGGS
jgi:hypothetical protein